MIICLSFIIIVPPIIISESCSRDENKLKLPDGLQWINSDDTHNPENAVPTGNNAYDICKATIPGKPGIHPGHSYQRICYVAYDWKEHGVPKYDVLTNPGKVTLEWVRGSKDSTIPMGAIPAGWDDYACEETYIARSLSTDDNGMQPGKLHRNGDFYYPFWGKEHKRSEFEVLVQISADSYEVSHVRYHLDKKKMATLPPASLSSVTLRNYDSYAHEIMFSKTITLTQEKSWGHVAGVSDGASATVSAGVPGFGEASMTVSAEASYEHNWGDMQSDATEVMVNAKVNIAPKRCMEAEIVAKRSKMTVPFTATFKEYNGGKLIKTSDKNGIFENVKSYSWSVKYHQSKPIEQC